MQSAVDRERFALGRRAGSGEVARTVAAAKAAGITNISLDVMLGTPNRPRTVWRKPLPLLRVCR